MAQQSGVSQETAFTSFPKGKQESVLPKPAPLPRGNLQEYIGYLQNRTPQPKMDDQTGYLAVNPDKTIALYMKDTNGNIMSNQPLTKTDMQTLCTSGRSIPALYLPNAKQLSSAEVSSICAMHRKEEVDTPVTPPVYGERTMWYGKIKDCQERNPGIAALLAILVGSFGMHHFYLGNHARGFLYLATTIFGLIFGFFFAYFYFLLMAVVFLSWCEAYMFLSSRNPIEFEQYNISDPRMRCYYKR